MTFRVSIFSGCRRWGSSEVGVSGVCAKRRAMGRAGSGMAIVRLQVANGAEEIFRSSGSMESKVIERCA